MYVNCVLYMASTLTLPQIAEHHTGQNFSFECENCAHYRYSLLLDLGWL